MDIAENKSDPLNEDSLERAREGDTKAADRESRSVADKAIDSARQDLVEVVGNDDALSEKINPIESTAQKEFVEGERQIILSDARKAYEEMGYAVQSVLDGDGNDSAMAGRSLEGRVDDGEIGNGVAATGAFEVSREDTVGEGGAGVSGTDTADVENQGDRAVFLAEQAEMQNGEKAIQQILDVLAEEDLSQEEMAHLLMEKLGIPPGVSPEEVFGLVARRYEESLGVSTLPEEIKISFIDNEEKVADEGIEDGAPDPESCQLDEGQFDILRKRARGQYSSEIGLGDDFSDGDIAREREQTELGLADEIKEANLSEKEAEFLKLIERGEDLLSENNPEKAISYLLEMKGQIDNCSKHLKCIYLQMEREMDKDPEKQKALQEDFFSLVSSIERLDEASRMIDEMIINLNKVKAGEEIPPEIKENLKKLLVILGAVAALLGVIIYIGDKMAKFIGAHQQAAGIAGVTGMSVGAVKLGAFSGLGVSAPFAAKIFCFANFLRLAWDENKRDRLVEKIFGISLPPWAKAPAKPKAAK